MTSWRAFLAALFVPCFSDRRERRRISAPRIRLFGKSVVAASRRRPRRCSRSAWGTSDNPPLSRKQDDRGRFALLDTYPICRWSGGLGPKIKAGDRQAPEGFYTITPDLMNPNSSQYLAINTGFPNAYDQANGRTGAFLMIHGGCSSAGCYAMTDEQISDIYALAGEAFFGGQRAFQLQAYPFRMTRLNVARHRNSPHMAFWEMIKQGYDHFEITHLEPKVDVCEKRYIFNAESTDIFGPADACPPCTVPAHIAAAVREKQRRDDIETAELINRGTPTLPVATGVDVWMTPTFLGFGPN